MAATHTAEELKTEANHLFKQSKFEEALPLYSRCVDLEPENAVYYSNRAACLLRMARLEEALQDSEKAVGLRPTWPRGYTRKGTALLQLNRLDDARKCYEEGMKEAAEGDVSALQKGHQAVLRAMMKASQEQQRQTSAGQQPVQGVWGSKMKLADRLRGKAEEKEAAAPRPAQAPRTPLIHRSPSHYQHWYWHHPADGSTRPPRKVVVDDKASSDTERHAPTRYAAAMLISHGGHVLLQTSHDHAELPSIDVTREALHTSVHAYVSKLFGAERIGETCVLAIENYPSLKSNWFRYVVGVMICGEELPDTPNTLSWQPLADIVKEKSVLVDTQITSLPDIETYLKGLTAARANPRSYPLQPFLSPEQHPVFDYHLVEVCLVRGGHALLVNYRHEAENSNWWGLPCTHIDSAGAEDIVFAASRVMRGLFGLVIDVEGLLTATCSPVPHADGKCRPATRFTVLASIQARDKFEPPEHPPHHRTSQWFPCSSLPDAIRPDVRAMLSRNPSKQHTALIVAVDHTTQ